MDGGTVRRPGPRGGFELGTTVRFEAIGGNLTQSAGSGSLDPATGLRDLLESAPQPLH